VTAILQELVYDSVVEGAVWPFDPEYIRPRHFHGQLECMLVRSGHAIAYLGTRAMPLRQGQLCWILPGVPHVMGGFSTDFDLWVIELDPALVSVCTLGVRGVTSDERIGICEDWAWWLGQKLAGREVVDIRREDAERIDEHAASVWRSGRPTAVPRELGALCELLLAATLPNVDDRRAPSAAELACCLLLASPTLDRNAVAGELGVSEGFLSRSFHREVGVTLVEHRVRTRVSHCLTLIRGGEHNLLRAALTAGFGSYSQFHRVFTRVAGQRPSEYLDGGRHRLELLVAADPKQPELAPALALPGCKRQRAPIDGCLVG
jgi:AraC-like DNA-binding protein